MTFPTRDWCTEEGARDLAEMIRRYWEACGKEIEVEVVSNGGGHDRKAVWGVRSTLVFFAPERAP